MQIRGVMKKLVICVTLCILSAWNTSLYAQLVVDNSISRVNMVKSLEGAGVRFSNITVVCPGVDQIAQFDGSLSNIGLDQGIILTSGSAFNAIGPNNLTGQGLSLLTAGDVDLDSIAGAATFDACVVEFDFETAGDSLKFDFVFGSEEYPQFVNNINDAFGFFISGPGISGPYDNDAENIALLPDGITPVSIKTINNGTSNNGPCQNCNYYVENGTGNIGEPQFTDASVVQYDGFTRVVQAKFPVSPCEIYHLKLVVADAKDKIQDSGVFLKQGSFQSKTANVVSRYKTVYEGCKDNELYFFKTTNKDSIEVKMRFEGTATNGEDYGIMVNGVFEAIPDSVILPANTTVKKLDIVIPQNGDSAEVETMVIVIENSDCFGNFGVSDSMSVDIRKSLELDLQGVLNTPDGLPSVCAGDSFELEAFVQEKDLSFQWLPESSNPDSTDNSYVTALDQSGQIIVTAKDTFGCTGTDTISVDVLTNPSGGGFDILQSEIFDASKVIFYPDTTLFTSAAKYFWTFNDSTGETSIETNPIHQFSGPGTYNVVLTVIDKFTDECGFVSDVDIEIKNLELPNIITPNGDGLNDVLKVGGLFNYRMQLTNRWGVKVLDSEIYNLGLDAGEISDGIYYYRVITESGATYNNWLRICR